MSETFNQDDWVEGDTDMPSGKVTTEVFTGEEWQPIPDEENPLKQAIDFFDGGQYKESEPVTALDYLWNQFKLGTIDSASFISALSQLLLHETISEHGGPQAGEGPGFLDTLATQSQLGAAVVGAEPSMKPPIKGLEYVGAPVRAVADPVNYMAPGANKAASFLTAAAAGEGAEVGGKVGEHIAGPEGQLVGSLVGGVGSGALPVVVKTAALAPAMTAWNNWRNKTNAYKEVPQTAAAGHAQRFLDRAIEELSPETFNSMVDDYKRIAHLLKVDDIPLFVMLADNPAAKAQVLSLIKTDPRVRNTVQTQVDNLAKAIDDRADAFFGERYTYVNTEGALVSTKNVSKRVADIDARINSISTGLTPTKTPEEIGTAIKNLAIAREAAVREEMSPKYTALLEEAEKAKVTMPASGVETVFNFIKENKIRDIFGKGTGVDNKVLSAWSPVKETTAPSKIIIPGQQPTPAQTKLVFKEVPFAQVESLKKEINRLQSGALTPDESRKLMQLETVLNEARASIKGNFNKQLLDLDREYYLRVGVPFGAQGIKDIDAKKYAEQVAPVIAIKPSAMRQYLNAVGTDGYGVATDAVLSKVYESFVKDGVLNTAGLRQYLKNNASVIDQVPGLRDRLVSATKDVSVLQLNKARLNKAAAAQDKIIADNFLQTTGSKLPPDYQAISSKMMNDGVFFNATMSDIKMASPEVSKAVLNNLRREVVNTAMNSTEGAVSYLSNPKRAAQIDRLFGAGYRKSVLDLARIGDAVKAVDTTKVADAIAKTELEKRVAGLTASGTLSVLRDRITSWKQKVAILGSRSGTYAMDQANKQAMVDLLINTNGLQRLSAMNKTLPNLSNPLSMNKMITTFVDLVPVMFYTPTKQAAIEQEGTY